MIASVSGQVASKTSTGMVVEVSGIGYLVQTPKPLLQEFAVGNQIKLFTSLVVREDSFQLFGFSSVEQLGLFDLLRSVSGVGPKIALAILSALSPSEVSYAVAEEDSKPFESVTGVGAKTAKLINLTLAGKVKAESSPKSKLDDNLLGALQSLGWSEKIAAPVVQQVAASAADKEMAVLIRECLALLSK